MATVDAAHLSESQYAAHRKELLGLMSQLRAVGAQGELDLPRITVIGNQSAGKSSVVEAISGIKVPRDTGTCTRCPMECRLSSSSNSWSCRISIRLEFDASGRPRKEVLERRFGDMITNKDEVEVGLRRAQLAVLNPSVSFEEILAMSAEDVKNGIPGLNPLPFSRNVVCVDLEGPELTDLMFLDLPGIIANAEQEIIDLVEEMVVSHIQGNCLILVALPMTDDIENQRALRLARQEDPAGRRTIGVLTKPDMLSVGSKVRDLWLDVIEGRKHILMHGYFCTRQPDDDERAKNITPAQARRAETTFFAETTPWSTTKYKERFGTENLVSSLSTILVQIINDRLPLIRSMANEGMDACRRELGSLPAKVVGEPATHMLNLVTVFCSEIGLYVEGQSDKSDLIHERNTAFADFKRSIEKTQPQFIACTVGQAGTRFFPIQIDTETRESATDLIVSQKAVYLTDIRTHITKSITRELPGNIPFSAKKTLITSFQHTWLACARDCFNAVKKSMLALLMRCIDEKFGRYELLQTRLKTCITDLAAKYFESCANFLLAMLEVEQMPFTQNSQYLQASTEKWLSRYKDERAAKRESNGEDASKPRKLGGAQPSASTPRHAEVFKFDTPASSSPKPQAEGFSSSPRPPSPSSTARTEGEKINNVLAQLAELGYPGVASEDLGKLRQVDEFETEITVMSEVRGYFECAYKRVIDNIPALIDAKFLRAMAQNLQQELISEFGLGSENANAVCAAFLVEDPRLVAKREDLMARSRRLEAVQIQLHNFGLNRTAGQV
ncbi:P-loop containing nucleoside triphosphate hydrolase protein [Mycena alexandri]|uniref:P-loop containing nucleoside triphosphate hydrolase protein n=1 Tax=Mycena alexandri TaxID=1745969 RepID=A0AAD6X728_9AGAR|nr:P-loop containing nucleoside triphosphate hydrolase protein [Mycena alexandri]